MAKWYSIANDGVVRGHSNLDKAVRKVRRGGRVQMGGTSTWYTPAEAARLLTQLKALKTWEAASRARALAKS